jgi:hypothetical protein
MGIERANKINLFKLWKMDFISNNNQSLTSTTLSTEPTLPFNSLNQLNKQYETQRNFEESGFLMQGINNINNTSGHLWQPYYK